MIVSPDFVMLNLPKTGSTFSRKVIKEAYENAAKPRFFWQKKNKENNCLVEDYFVENLFPKNLKDQHGAYSQIPENQKHKKVISILRDPYQMMRSHFEFEWWKRNPLLNEETIKEKFSNFPELEFQDYLEYNAYNVDHYFKAHFNIPKEVKIGNLSIQWILMFFKDPFKVLENLNEEYLNSEEFLNDIGEIRFLNNAQLNEELYQLLSEFGLPEKAIDFIKKEKKIHVTKPKVEDQNEIWTEKSLAYMQEYEPLILNIYQNFIE